MLLKAASTALVGAILGVSGLLAWQRLWPNRDTRRTRDIGATNRRGALPEIQPVAARHEIPREPARHRDRRLDAELLSPEAVHQRRFSDEQGGLWQDKNCEPATVNIVAFGDDLPFKDGTLDYVLSSHVIEHFFDPVKALREWQRVIRPGGYIFIIAPHKDGRSTSPARSRRRRS